METEFNVNDLIALSYGQQPIDFEQAFNSLITDRLAQAVETKKTEIAQSIFKGLEPEDEDDDEELDDGYEATNLEQGEEDGATA
jgi:hypothetical protein